MTIAQQLKVKSFPFTIKNDRGNTIYYEDSDNYWQKLEHDDKGNRIYFEDSDGSWEKREYNDKGNQIYYENSDGYWEKLEYNDKGNEIYYENSDGDITDNRPKTELTLDEIAKNFNISVNQLKIKK